MRKLRVVPAIDDNCLSPESQVQVNHLQIFAEETLEENNQLREENARLKDEVAILKGEKKRPVFKPSGMNEDAGRLSDTAQIDPDAPAKKAKRAGSAKRSKTGQLATLDQIVNPDEAIPQGSRFKGYHDFTVQDIVITTKNTRYRLARWQTPDGRYLTGKLPKELQGRHFGPGVVAHILYQHHHCHVTQPLLHEQLREWGVDISAGQINAILLDGKAPFHDEKDALLAAGLALSAYVTVDDSGARHQGKNGYVTHIGNQYFASFHSSMSKSRVNFLELLRAGQTDYRITASALAYMKEQGLSQVFLDDLRSNATADFADKAAWESHMESLGMKTPRYRRIATEGALLGSLRELHIAKNMAIISDDVGQVRSQVWDLYADLKSYKLAPAEELKPQLKKRFDTIFTQKTSYTSLNLLLLRLHKNKSELLLVLERPEIPLHTNGSEGDIRGHVLKQKISGGTRSDLGRKCRDTFSSLKKTCRKLGISFWSYLIDRISCSDQIPSLHQIIEQRIAATA